MSIDKDQNRTERNLLPPSVNYHLNSACNYECSYCFARFNDSEEYLGRTLLSREKQLRIVGQLADAGFEKITFAGGEPTLVPWLPELMSRAKEEGMTTMLVSNGSRLTDPTLLADTVAHLDWMTLSIDSVDPETNRQIGRAQGGEPLTERQYLDIFHASAEAGVRTKLNTVVSRLNCREDMSAFVEAAGPERWKLFQVLPVDGQNDGDVEPNLIDRPDFEAFVDRHRCVEAAGVNLVPESNEDMTGSYAMIDPAGRFFDNTSGRHTYSQPILQAGVTPAFRQVSFDPDRFEDRGGRYDWEA